MHRHVLLPPHITRLVKQLEDQLFDTSRHEQKLRALTAVKSVYFSEEKLQTRARQIADDKNFDAHETLSQLERLSEGLATQASEIKKPFTEYNELRAEVELVKKCFIAIIQAAARTYHDYIASLLSTLDPPDRYDMLEAAKIFSDFAVVSYTQEEGLTYSVVSDAKHDSFQSLVGSFVRATQKYPKNRKRDFVLSYIAIKTAEFLSDPANSKFAGKIELDERKESKMKLIVTEQVFGQERAMDAALASCTMWVDKYKPPEISENKRSSESKEPLFSEFKEAKKLEKKAEQDYKIVSQAQDQLAEESKKAHDELAKNVNNFTDGVVKVNQDLHSATERLARDIDDDDFETRQRARDRFLVKLDESERVNFRNQRINVNGELDNLARQYGGKISSQYRPFFKDQLDKSEVEFKKIKQAALELKRNKEEELKKIEQEKFQKEIVDALYSFIFNNLAFLNAQTYCGWSDYQINGVKVQRGVKETADVLESKMHPLNMLRQFQLICSRRIKAGSNRFLFFKVRTEKTDQIYRLGRLIGDPTCLTAAKVAEFKNALARIKENNVRIDPHSRQHPIML